MRAYRDVDTIPPSNDEIISITDSFSYGTYFLAAKFYSKAIDDSRTDFYFIRCTEEVTKSDAFLIDGANLDRPGK